MTGWLLVITILGGPQGDLRAAVGLMFAPQLCQVAGAAVVRLLAAEVPGGAVSFQCVPQVTA